MPDDVPMFTSCSLCLQPDEVQSMVTVEIDRRIAGGRTAIMICRTCARAVLEALGKADPPLLSTLIFDSTPRAEPPAAIEPVIIEGVIERGSEADETQAESAELHEGDQSDDGKTTD